MPNREYVLEIEEGGEFDVSFTRYAKSNHRGAARLAKWLENFEKNPKRIGEFFRGSGDLSVFVVPSREQLDGDGEAGIFALVDAGNATVTPVRFIAPSAKHRWKDHERWAEKLLGI